MSVPLYAGSDGVIRIGETNITLESVIARHLEGDTPQMIHESFEVLSLNEIYAVVAYYLSHQREMDDDVQRREEITDQEREKWEALFPPSLSRDKLLKRLESGR